MFSIVAYGKRELVEQIERMLRKQMILFIDLFRLNNS